MSSALVVCLWFLQARFLSDRQLPMGAPVSANPAADGAIDQHERRYAHGEHGERRENGLQGVNDFFHDSNSSRPNSSGAAEDLTRNVSGAVSAIIVPIMRRGYGRPGLRIALVCDLEAARCAERPQRRPVRPMSDSRSAQGKSPLSVAAPGEIAAIW